MSHPKLQDLRANWFNVLNEDLALPAAVLYANHVQQNINWMQHFADIHGLKLCPHGKTTMCPTLFHLQLEGGAWGISLATVEQVKVAHSFGVRRILMVNQLIGKTNMDIISNMLSEDPSFEFACIVDSVTNIQQLGTYFRRSKQQLRVLLEFGLPSGGRTGVRNIEQEDAAISEIGKYVDCLSLVGVEFYEGIATSPQQVRDWVRYIQKRIQLMAWKNSFTENAIIVSAAGSSWFDVVAEELATMTILSEDGGRLALDKVVRPGSYLTHEVGTYDEAKCRLKMQGSSTFDLFKGIPPMVTALQVWAYVQSLPEPGLAIVALGKRDEDASFNCEFPIPRLHFRPTTGSNVLKQPRMVNNAEWKVTHLMDQHCFMKIGMNDDIQVGDMVAFEACYPGTTMDKFRNIFLADEKFNVLDVLQTFF